MPSDRDLQNLCHSADCRKDGNVGGERSPRNKSLTIQVGVVDGARWVRGGMCML